ncbi:MAG: presqualene diphosphate synthase HpnD [Deltaproteobacteria bacterium]|nr:presqualene diphosphate synthase HpnD [Deltaproteobacteria bacterium]
MNPQHYCHQICKKSGSNFVYAFYLLGKKRRHALEAFYAFCRLVDDAVDEAPSAEEAQNNLRFWREEIARIYRGEGEHIVSQALTPVVRAYDIPQKYLEEIVAGCEMDLVKKNYVTFQELELYCHRVASCVGLVSLRIFGIRNNRMIDAGGIALGKALQLTNILRDISTDLARGRIYIPEEDLRQSGVSKEALEKHSLDDLNLADLLYFEIKRAREFYQEAWQSFPKFGKERRQLVAAILMGRIYEAILDKIAKDPLSVFRQKVKLTGKEKSLIALKVLLDTYLK